MDTSNSQNENQQNNHSQENQHTTSHNTEKSTLSGLEGFFDTYLRIKFPLQLPAKVKEFIVKYGPWITLIVLILAAFALVPLLLLALGLTAVSLPYAAVTGTAGVAITGWLSIILSLAVLVMEAIAIPGLLKRQLSAWKLVYYAALLSAASSLINLSIVSFIIGLLISMYILFQIREYYK